MSLMHGTTNATSVILKAVRVGSTGASMADVSFDDAAPDAFPADPSVSPFTGTFTPAEKLAKFAGQTAAGPWTLRIVDLAENKQG